MEMDQYLDFEWETANDNQLFKKILEERIFEFLLGLNDELDQANSRILDTKPLPLVQEVYATIRREEARLAVMMRRNKGPKESSALQVEAATLKTDSSAFIRRKEDKDKLWCEVCKKRRHTKETCWKIHGKPS